MNRIVGVEALTGHRLRLRFSDGVEGTVDVSHLVGRGVFVYWEDEANFSRVSIGSGGELIWSNQVDLCPDALYLQMTGKRPTDILENLEDEAASA